MKHLILLLIAATYSIGAFADNLVEMDHNKISWWMRKNGEFYSHDPKSKLKDNETCLHQGILKLTVRAAGEDLSIEGTIDESACLADLTTDTYTTVHSLTYTGQFTLLLNCQGSDLGPLNGISVEKLFEQLGTPGKFRPGLIVTNYCANSPRISSTGKTTLDFDADLDVNLYGTLANYKRQAHAETLVADADRALCLAKGDGQNIISTNACRVSTTVHYDRSLTNGTADELDGKDDVTVLESASLLFPVANQPFYNGGKMLVTKNQWSGEVVYTGADQEPKWIMNRGEERAEGKVELIWRTH